MTGDHNISDAEDERLQRAYEVAYSRTMRDPEARSLLSRLKTSIYEAKFGEPQTRPEAEMQYHELFAQFDKRVRSLWPEADGHKEQNLGDNPAYKTLMTNYNKTLIIEAERQHAVDVVSHDAELWGKVRSAGLNARNNGSHESEGLAEKVQLEVYKHAEALVHGKHLPGVISELHKALDKTMSDAVEEEAKSQKSIHTENAPPQNPSELPQKPSHGFAFPRFV